MKLLSAVLTSAMLLNARNYLLAQTPYIGSGSITQGLATTTTANLFPGCAGARVTAVGTITSTDGKIWTVPAQTNFASGPYLPDLYNQCSSVTPANIGGVNLNSLPVTVIDAGGDVITGFLFGDNYFELYINGVLVGADPTPYTPFNSCVVKFKVSRPYTIAVKLVDWEENLGVGTELNMGNAYHAGDGGFIAQFSDGTVTDATWKAQTFYIAPIENLGSVVELPDGTRSSATATTTPTCNANCYGIHYDIPAAWNAATFNDAGFPSATLYTAATVGVNFPAYQNFLSQWSNARFIWSSNLILDNLVLVRKTVGATTASSDLEMEKYINVLNPFTNKIVFSSEKELKNVTVNLIDVMGRKVATWNEINVNAREKTELQLQMPVTNGVYFLNIQNVNVNYSTKVINQ